MDYRRGTRGVVGITIAGGLLLAFPLQMSVMGGLMIHYLQALGAPAGTIATELNPSYTGTVAAATSPWSRHQTRVLVVSVVTVPYVLWSKKQLVPAR